MPTAQAGTAGKGASSAPADPVHSCGPYSTSRWLAERLPLLDGLQLVLLPGRPDKFPAVGDKWEQHPGLAIPELQAAAPANVCWHIGANGSIHIAIDIDGARVIAFCQAHGCDPLTADTWRIIRTSTPDRLKVIFTVTPEQRAILTAADSGKAVWVGKGENGPDDRGEELALFGKPGTQIVVLGDHYTKESNFTDHDDQYAWAGRLPAEAAPIPAEWFELLEGVFCGDRPLRPATLRTVQPASSRKRGAYRSSGEWNSSKGNPCPICGRHHSGGCSIHSDGHSVWCKHGETCSAPDCSKSGETITGRDGQTWAYVRTEEQDPFGERSLFVIHDPTRKRKPPSRELIRHSRNGHSRNGHHQTPVAQGEPVADSVAQPVAATVAHGQDADDDSTSRRRDDRPVELQAGDILYAVAHGHYAVRADTVHAYDPAQGIWVRHPDADIGRAAQAVLRQLYVVKRDKETGREWEERPHGSAAEVRNTVASLRTTAGHGPFVSDAPPPVIVFTNGTYHLADGQLRPHSPDNGATYRIEAPFVAAADCPDELRRYAWTCFPDGALEILRAYIRWLIDPTIRYGEAFHFVGPTGSGKGTAIDLGQSLLPPSLVRAVGHPALLKDPDKLYQLAHGGRLVCFADCPVRLHQQGHLGNFYELVENKLQTVRRLHASDTTTLQLYARCVVGSIGPLQLGDGADGFLRRVLTLQTLPRQGEPDPTIRDGLIGTTTRHQQLRGELCAWALAMAAEDVERILSRNDSEGLLRAGADAAAKGSDTVTLFIDEALIPHPLGPDAPVTDHDLGQMFEAYLGWCRASNVQYGKQKTNFIGDLRTALGPGRCLGRGNIGRGSSRRRTPHFDAGFTLRPGILGSPDPTLNRSHVGDRTTFDRLKLGSGGLEALANLPPARRLDGQDSPDSPALTHPQPGSQQLELHKGNVKGGFADSPDSPPPESGLSQGRVRAESGLSQSLKAPAMTGISADRTPLSQGSPFLSREQSENGLPEPLTTHVSPIWGDIGGDSPDSPLPPWLEPLLALVADDPGLPSDAYANRLEIFRRNNGLVWSEPTYAIVAAALAGHPAVAAHADDCAA